MSSSLEVILKRKDEDYKKGITLVYLYTTPARELANECNIIYGNGDNVLSTKEGVCFHPLSSDLLEEILGYYETLIAAYEKEIVLTKEEIKILNEVLYKVNNLEIYQHIKEEIEQKEYEQEENEELLSDYRHQRNLWFYCVKYVYTENTNFSTGESEFELVYHYN